MQEYDTLTAVDLGSNSFRLQVVRVVDGQIYELDSLKEMVRLAAGLDVTKTITESAQQTALAYLKRFGERLRGFPVEAVRAVDTNSLRVTKNAKEFLVRAEEVLGFPIEIIAGREEARLIYIGVAHSLPASQKRRLVVDIGGDSTECTIGTNLDPCCMESLYMGCVSHSLRHFPDGKINARRMQEAELAARAEIQIIISEFSSVGYGEAIASSGTARALGDMIAQNGFGERVITPQGMTRLCVALIKAGDWRRLSLPGLPPDRAPVIAGGFAIMSAVMKELHIDRMSLSDYALRHGVLFDLIGRVHQEGMREATVQQFMRRYQVDLAQARRVEHTALSLFETTAAALPEIQREQAVQILTWAARLHVMGISIAYSSYHKHSAYIAQSADMPGFSTMDQTHLALLLLSHRGSLNKVRAQVMQESDWALILTLRLAVLLNRRRVDSEAPPVELVGKQGYFQLFVDKHWLKQHPLSETVLENEVAQWRAVDRDFRVKRTVS